MAAAGAEPKKRGTGFVSYFFLEFSLQLNYFLRTATAKAYSATSVVRHTAFKMTNCHF